MLRPPDVDRLRDKINLVLRVNYIASILCLAFALICRFPLQITHVIPYVFLGYGTLNVLNLIAFRKHKKLALTYGISLVLSLIASFVVVLYSGGINSPFIFVLGLIVFASYVTTREHGQLYLNLILFLVVLIYSQQFPDFRITENAVPESSRDIFALLSIFFSFFLLGNVFGRNLLHTHNRLYRSKKALQQQMKEREFLLKEIHHRVKNNLQTVSSLLSLQSRNIDDPKMKDLIKGSQNRVITMAMIHEMLYMRNDFSKIEFKTYVQELVEYLIRSVRGNSHHIALEIDIPNMKMGLDTAVPLGLLINEAVTNSLKYGIPEGNGKIYVLLSRTEDDHFLLKIGDDGVGFPESVTHKNTQSLGLKLIHNLARQLKGSIKRDLTQKGTCYNIRFQEVEHKLPPAGPS